MSGKTVIMIGVAAGVLLLLLLLIAGPSLINANHYRATVESALGSSLGRQVRIGHLHFSLLHRTFTANDVSVADDETFSRSAFLQTKSLAVGFEVWPLLFSHRLQVTYLTLVEPQLNVLRSASGTWNFASLGVREKSGIPASSSDSSGALQDDSVPKLNIANGRVSISSVASGADERSYGDISLVAIDISTVSAFPVAIELGTSGAGRITLAGTAGPLVPNGTELIVHMKLHGRNAPIHGLEGLLRTLNIPLPPGMSLQSGSLNTDMTLDGPLGRLVITGPVAVSNMNISGFNLAAWVGAVAALSGIRNVPMIQIESMNSEVRVAPEGIQLNDLNAVLPNFGTVTGAGTISASNVLNFQMLAKPKAGSSVLGGVRAIASLGQGSGGLSFRIQGTTSYPVFVPDIGGAVGGTIALPFRSIGRIVGRLTGETEPQESHSQ